MTYQTLHVFDNFKVWQLVLVLIVACIIGYGIVRGVLWIADVMSRRNE